MRQPAVSGRFYPEKRSELIAVLKQYFASAEATTTGRVVVAPHAGYPFSGLCAAYSYTALQPAETYIIIGPGHYHTPEFPAVSTENWQTPLGEVEVDRQLIQLFEGVVRNERAHSREHSVEVQLPFLQYRFNQFKIVPLTVGHLTPDTARQLAADLQQAVEQTGRRVGLIASSDLNHYQPEAQLRENDKQIYQPVLEMDVETFYRRSIAGSVCGYGPIMVAMQTLGVSQAELLDYRTSTEVTGDDQPGVGYASLVFT